VLVDMNEDVLAPDIKQFCQDTNMVEVIAAMHGNSLLPTHQRGSKAIDGIFLSPALLEEAKGGEVTISDHQAVGSNIFDMFHTMDITRAAGQHLKMPRPLDSEKIQQVSCQCARTGPTNNNVSRG